MSQPTFRSRVREPLGVANCWRENSDNAREKRRENLVSLRPSARGTLTRAPRVWARLRVASFRAMEPPAVPRAVERLSAATLRNSSSGATSISTEAVFFGDPRPSLAAALRRTTEAWGFSYAVFWREEDDFARCVFHAADCVEKEEAATLRQVRFHPGRGAVGRAMRDRRGFDLCANLADMDETTFAKQELVAERGTRNVVCCRVRGGVLELGTAGDLCPVHISGACPCASITPVAPRRASFEASLNNDNEHRRSPLRVGSSNERAWREIEARAREGAELDSLLGLFDAWHGGGQRPSHPDASPSPPPAPSPAEAGRRRRRSSGSGSDVGFPGEGRNAAQERTQSSPPPKWGAEPAPAVQSPRRRRRRARGPTPNTTKGGDERVRARFESVRHFLDDVAREFDRVSDLDVLESADGEDAREATKNQ